MIARILSDSEELSGIVTIIPTLFGNIVNMFVISAVLFYFSWKLSLIAFVTVPFYYLSLRLLTKKLQKTADFERRAYSRLNESLREKIENLSIIKRFIKYDFFLGLFSDDAKKWTSNRNSYRFSYLFAQNITYFITFLTPAIILGYGGMSVMNGTLTLGALVAFFAYVQWIYEPMQIINSNLIELQRLNPLSERFFEIVDSPGESTYWEFPFPENYSIRYDNVRFAYKDKEIIKNASFGVNEDDRIAIVGPNGSGKSTLVNLLVRFYDPQSGTVSIGGKDLKKFKLEDLRKNVHIVRQDDYLFNMSIKENILLGDVFGEDNFFRAVKSSGVDSFVQELSNGYDTIVGNGFNLSDGQRQRVCLARSLIRKPRLLIMDEATSAIDFETEFRIFENLKETKCCIIMISHRLSTIKKLDRIFFIDDGTVIDSGKHEELIERCVKYRTFIEKQSLN